MGCGSSEGKNVIDIKKPLQKSKTIQNLLQLYFCRLPNDPEYIKLKTDGSIPEGPNITLDDVLLPDDPSKMMCLTFLKRYVKSLENNKSTLLVRGHAKESKGLEKTWMEAFTMQTKLSKLIEEEKMDMKNYLTMLEIVFERDKGLAVHYKKLDCRNRMAFVVERMKDCKKEIDSLKAEIQKQK